MRCEQDGSGSSALMMGGCGQRLSGSRTKNKLTVAEALHNCQWVRTIIGSLSVQAIVEYLQVWARVSEVHLSDDEDRFIWRWTRDGCYSAKSVYALLQQGNTGFEGAKRIWLCWAPPKVKFFLWLSSHRRLWTADRRIRHGLEAQPICWLCDQEQETVDHILVNCSFARAI